MGPATKAPVASSTYIGYYPPLYYLLTGWPTLVSTSGWSLHLSRLLGGLFESALLGLAFALIIVWSRNRWLLVGFTVSLTPMALYLAGVLNPSGLELTACAVVIVSTTLLVFQHSRCPPTAVIVAWTATAALLCFVRPISPAYLAAILFFVVALRPRHAWQLLHDRRMRMGAGVVLFAAILAISYILVEHSYRQEHFPFPPGLSNVQILRLIVGQLPTYARQTVGSFGTPMTNAPALALVLCSLAAGLLILGAILLVRRRDAILLAVYGVGVFVVLPIAAAFPIARSNGLIWVGRYSYPVAICLPIIAAALLADKQLPVGRAALFAPISMTVAAAVTFYWVLRCYTVGTNGPLIPSTKVPDGWQPPIPADLMIVFMVVLTATLGVAIFAALRPHRPSPLRAQRLIPSAVETPEAP